MIGRDLPPEKMTTIYDILISNPKYHKKLVNLHHIFLLHVKNL